MQKRTSEVEVCEYFRFGMATSASSDGDEKTKANRLLNEKSPYLLQASSIDYKV